MKRDFNFFRLYKKFCRLQNFFMKFLLCLFFSIFVSFALLAKTNECNLRLTSQKSKTEAKIGKNPQIYKIIPLSKENQKKFLREIFDLTEDVNFDAMLDEIKTYGGFAGLCSQLSQYLKETNSTPELLKFKAKRIHSCDGFFMPKNGYVMFSPTSKHLRIVTENKIEVVFLDMNFAVCKKSDFYKYLTFTTEGIDD